MLEKDKPVAARAIFATGSGRCGTQFLSRVMGQESCVASVHERFPLVESFHRYCKWYGLPVDHQGFLATMDSMVRDDLQTRAFSFEASAYLSFSIEELFERFGAKFILLVRSPDRVVNSYLRKGWYTEPVQWSDAQLAPSYQATPRFHHFLCRIMPRGEELSAWRSLTRVGKLAWYWVEVNRSVLEQFRRIGQEHTQLVRLEDLDYARYRKLCRFVGFATEHTLKSYHEIVAERPNAKPQQHFVENWTPQEKHEFETIVGDLATELGYEYRTAVIAADTSSRTPHDLAETGIRRQNPRWSWLPRLRKAA